MGGERATCKIGTTPCLRGAFISARVQHFPSCLASPNAWCFWEFLRLLGLKLSLNPAAIASK